MSERSALRSLAPAAVAVALVVGACGGGVSVDAASGAATTAPTATSAPTPTAAPTATATPAPTATPAAPPGFEIDPDLLLRLPDGWLPLVEGDSQQGPTDEPPAGGTLPPPGSQGNRWKYTGVLGRLGPDERVVAAVADPPPAVEGAAPLTGVPGRSPNRRALIVKIDNVSAARPQIGLNEADIVYEELVESGVTRFAAVFHSTRPATIGPVRSGRSTDIGIVDSYSEPIFAFSGANSIYERLIDKQPIVNRSAELFNGYWRSGGRPAPHNLYTGADTMLDSAARGSRPPAHFAYREPGAGLHPTAVEATTVRLTYLAGVSTTVEYRWNRGDRGWRRWQSGTRHVDANGVQLAPANLIVQYVNYIDTGMTDKFGEDLYEGVSVGTGDALIFTDGHVIAATWTRPTLRSVTTFTDADGNHVELTPGQTHVSLIAPGGASWG